MTGLCETHFRFNLGNGFYQWDEIKIRKQHIFVDYEFNFSFFFYFYYFFSEVVTYSVSQPQYRLIYLKKTKEKKCSFENFCFR